MLLLQQSSRLTGKSLALSCWQSRCWAQGKGQRQLSEARGQRGREKALPASGCPAWLHLPSPKVELTFDPWRGWGRSGQAMEVTVPGVQETGLGPGARRQSSGLRADREPKMCRASSTDLREEAPELEGPPARLAHPVFTLPAPPPAADNGTAPGIGAAQLEGHIGPSGAPGCALC